MVILFSPLFLVGMLPCVLCCACRRNKSGENVVKKFFNVEENSLNGAGDVEGNVQGKNSKSNHEGFPMTSGRLKSMRLNNRRASSTDDDDEELQGWRQFSADLSI